MCINYRQLNSIMKKNQYPLPLISEIQDRIGNAKIFLKIDLKQAYHQIRIKEGNKQKAAFRLKEGLYKPLIIQFRLINVLAIFQKRINSVLEEHLDEFIIAYLDNIIIYSNSKEEHFQYMEQVLQKLVNKKMLVAIKKYKFHTTKTKFYRFIIKLKKLSIDPKKIKAIVNW